MKAGVKRWTIIRNSGATETFWGPGSGMTSPMYSYLEVLGWVYRDQMSGGSAYDRPNMLLADGKIVIPSLVTDLAYKYCTEKDEAYRRAVADIDSKHDRDFTGE